MEAQKLRKMNETLDIFVYNIVLSRKRIFNTVLVSMLLCIGIVANIFVIFIYKFRLGNKRQERYFIPALAIVDLTAIISGSSLSVLRNIFAATFPSEAICKILWYTTSSVTPISALLLMVISISRYHKICQPQKPESTKRCKNLILFFTTCAVSLLAIPMVFLHGLRPFTVMHQNSNYSNVTGVSCTDIEIEDRNLRALKIVYMIVVFLIIVTSFLTLIILYIRIGLVIYSKFGTRKSKNSNTDAQNVPSATSEESSICTNTVPKRAISRNRNPKIKKRTRHNFTFMFMAISALFICTYTPTMAFLLIPGRNPNRFWHDLSIVELNAYLTLSRMYLFAHALNPFVYLYFDFAFRCELTRCLSRL